jgi:hypothetical protein
MSSPTFGTLILSDGFRLDACNPSVLWSDTSRFLAVPQWRYMFGLRLRQRLLILDTVDRLVYASKPLACFFSPNRSIRAFSRFWASRRAAGPYDSLSISHATFVDFERYL